MKAMDKIATTEMRNPASVGIDRKSTWEILRIINTEDKKVPYAVETALDEIAAVTDRVVAAFKQGGRLLYIGAGTSGRLGVLDASECPPTYGVSPQMVQGIIAGGEAALTHSIEGAEDDGQAGEDACKAHHLTSKDVLIGITANGGAPFVVQALRYAKSLGCAISAISCNQVSPVFDLVEPKMRIYLPVGPEIITGSTRMKSGTAQKLVLNMITTTAMIRLGKVYNNLMVDLKPVNAKLVDRSIRMIQEITACGEEMARDAFRESGSDTRKAIVMVALGVDAPQAERLLSDRESLGQLFSVHHPKRLAKGMEENLLGKAKKERL